MRRPSLDIPQGKRTLKYRFLEILPGAVSYGGVILLFILSFFSPFAGAIYLLLIISITLVKAVAVAYRTYGGYKAVDMAERVDWVKRCEDLENPHEAYERLRNTHRESYNFSEHVRNLKAISSDPDANKNYIRPSDIYHAVIMVAYNEGIETMQPSIEAVRDTDFPNDRIIFVLGYEERGGEQIEKNAKYLKNLFKDTFKDFIIVKHPDGIKGEITGKGPNLCCAARELSKYIVRKRIDREKVMITSIDSDNQMHKKYLDSVAYEFCARNQKTRQRRSYQPVCLFMNNIWDAAAPMRVIAMSNSFFNIIQTMRPHMLWNFASHSQPLAALEDMNYWSKRTIVEDGHQYWRSYFYFKGDYDTVPIRVPIYQDAVIDETVPATLKAQFVQLRRWAYGASDVAYVGNMLFRKNREVPFWKTFVKFMKLFYSHITRSMIAPIVAVGGWVPMLMNMSTRKMVAFNLPMVVSVVQTIAVVGALMTVVVSLKILPKRPAKYGKSKSLAMVAQWVFSPIVAICYSSASAYVAQTKLMLGHYMEKFDVTNKVVKK
ncbi:glycosyltransferase family 2 protein [Candidatus Saccharibacteria bacterium]|nr:glycosyltransferase family 2 protein [Candidatus Saccharibacteria bacterium]